MRRITAAVVLPLLAPAAHAQPDNGSPPETIAASADEPHDGSRLVDTTALWHNDAAVFQPFSPTDKWFTNGFRVQAGFAPPDDPGHWTRVLAEGIPTLGMEPDRVRWGIAIGQEMYTPAVINSPVPNPDDRPFAGYLYGGGVLQRSDDRMLDELRFDIGIVGEGSGAEDTQKFVHRAFVGQVNPEGWDDQLANEPTFQLSAARRWRVGLFEPEPSTGSDLGGFGVDLVPEIGFRAGTVRVDANAGLTLRAGVGLQDHFGPDRFQSPIEIGARAERDWSWYVFGRVGGEAIAHDLFLDGNVFVDGGPSVEREGLVGQLSGGIQFRYKAFELGWQVTWESERFEDQSSPHAFGTYTFGWSFDF
ncbi:MAG: lipid A deacylase LpxR family protein [Planctomycetota bacterium]